MTNILVTGGAGYIGAHCCKELSRSGLNPVVIDNLIYGHRENVKWGDFILGDIGDMDLLRKFFSEFKIEAVMHFAAYAYVGESISNPMKYYVNNIQKTINLLNVMKEKGIDYFIFSSSCATYGNPEKIPIDEKHPQKPISPYGKSKFFVEEILKDYAHAYGLKFISLRYFNAAGADPDCEIGEKHEPETHLIPLILDVAASKRQAIQVFGSDYDTKDGSCVRDYVHVTDLAAAHTLALKNLLDGGASSFYNLGTGKGNSVFEIIRQAEIIVGKDIPFEDAGRREGDPAVLLASKNKACDILGWQPRYTDIDAIIQTAWNWHQSLTP